MLSRSTEVGEKHDVPVFIVSKKYNMIFCVYWEIIVTVMINDISITQCTRAYISFFRKVLASLEKI